MMGQSPASRCTCARQSPQSASILTGQQRWREPAGLISLLSRMLGCSPWAKKYDKWWGYYHINYHWKMSTMKWYLERLEIFWLKHQQNLGDFHQTLGSLYDGNQQTWGSNQHISPLPGLLERTSTWNHGLTPSKCRLEKQIPIKFILGAWGFQLRMKLKRHHCFFWTLSKLQAGHPKNRTYQLLPPACSGMSTLW